MVIDTQATPAMAEDVDPAYPRRDRANRSAMSSCRTITPCACWARRPTAPSTSSRAGARGTSSSSAAGRTWIRKSSASRGCSGGVETVPGLTWPTLVFEGAMTLWMGGLEVRGRTPGARPHQGRHGGLAAGGPHPLQRRPRGVRRDAPMRGRRLSRRLARDARRDRGPGAGDARARPGRRADDAGACARRRRGHARVCHGPSERGERRRSEGRATSSGSSTTPMPP